MVPPSGTRRNQTEYPVLAELIRTRREQLELSQTFVANKVGVDQSTLARWENGNRTPSGPAFYRLWSFLRFTQAELDAAMQKPA